MAKKKSPVLTEAEVRIMNILWREGSGTVKDVLKGMPSGKKFEYSTILTFLRILEQKGFTRHKKKGRAFVHYPKVNREQARGDVVRYMVNRFYGGSAGQMAVDVIGHKNIKTEELKAIKNLLKDKK